VSLDHVPRQLEGLIETDPWLYSPRRHLLQGFIAFPSIIDRVRGSIPLLARV
jgi:hypothetical protein